MLIRKQMILLILALFFVGYAGSLMAQEERLIDRYKNALIPRPDRKSQAANQNETRGIRGAASEPIQDADGVAKPSLTLHLEFKFNSDELTPHSVKYLDELGKAFQDLLLRGYIYSIEGHTDNVAVPYNVELSRKRAMAVADYLTKTFGLDIAQFDVKGFGRTKPVASNDTEEGRKQNRRVVIVNTIQTFNAPISERPRITVSVKYARAKEEKTLRDGDTLTNRDNYAVEFMPQTSAHIYIYRIDTTGSITTLFPNPELSFSSEAVEPGRLYRVPNLGRWLNLDENKGQEHIVVVAQKESLKDPLKVCKKVMGIDDIALASTKSAGISLPDGVTARGMGGIRTKNDAEVTEVSEPKNKPVPLDYDMNNVFVWKLSFLHQ
ncbi:MAG: OmpA family protein [Deltaproteobacteria bacterium]|nr:OmpA family protein [Deltaproteobacteria bacterium]